MSVNIQKSHKNEKYNSRVDAAIEEIHMMVRRAFSTINSSYYPPKSSKEDPLMHMEDLPSVVIFKPSQRFREAFRQRNALVLRSRGSWKLDISDGLSGRPSRELQILTCEIQRQVIAKYFPEEPEPNIRFSQYVN